MVQKYWFVADEHYGHANIIKYCNRPWLQHGDLDEHGEWVSSDVKQCRAAEMDEGIIANHNAVVEDGDIVVHAGDFTLAKKEMAGKYIARLKGNHVFLGGSHDKWLGRAAPMIWEKRFDDKLIVVCHYAMRTWPESHYGSYQLHGHSHGKLEPMVRQYDIGVDSNEFYPVSLAMIMDILGEENAGVA